MPMRLAELFTSRGNVDASGGTRPADEELDLFGLSHPGLVRTDNQDHFLLATVHPQVVVHGTSIPDPESLPLRGQRLATIMLVADGVGGIQGGEEASRRATQTITRYIASTLRCYHTAGSSQDREFLDALRTAALEAHAAVRADAGLPLASTGTTAGIVGATTLTVGIVVWPWLYVVQVGDSRCYCLHRDKLRQITRDQTVAQLLVDEGALKPEHAARSPYSHVLASAIGGEEARPEVTRVDVRERGTVILVCSDGLTKHVTDDEIAEHLGRMENAEQVARALLALALERGGTDNITMVVGRALEQRP